jgi:hypothetical protein
VRLLIFRELRSASVLLAWCQVQSLTSFSHSVRQKWIRGSTLFSVLHTRVCVAACLAPTLPCKSFERCVLPPASSPPASSPLPSQTLEVAGAHDARARAWIVSPKLSRAALSSCEPRVRLASPVTPTIAQFPPHAAAYTRASGGGHLPPARPHVPHPRDQSCLQYRCQSLLSIHNVQASTQTSLPKRSTWWHRCSSFIFASCPSPC